MFYILYSLIETPTFGSRRLSFCEAMDFLASGAAAIAKLEARSVELHGLIGSTFPPKSLDAISAEFEAQASSAAQGAPNATVAKLVTLVREEAARSVDELKQAEMWIYLKAPAVSDGNNFGVDVQNFVAGEIKAMRVAIQEMVDSASKYHWDRATGLEKAIVNEPASEISESKSEEKENDKTTTKSSTSSKSTTKSGPKILDFQRYLVSLDVKQYFACYNQLVDMRNCYAKANALFIKNQKRLSDPRGDGGDGPDRGVMSMF